MIMKMNDYPWSNIPRANKRGEFHSRLVSTELNENGKDIYWARNWEGHPALMVEYKCEPWKPVDLPQFQNICIEDHRYESCLIIELCEEEMSQLFYRVCVDIITALQDMPSEAYRNACILRLEHWSKLLRISRYALSSEAQKGLIAELLLLKKLIENVYTDFDVINGWVGPEAAAKDFSYGQIFIEVKSKRNSSIHRVLISSEEQLTVNASESLYLYVVEINDAPDENKNSLSLNDVVDEVRRTIEDEMARLLFDDKVSRVGFTYDADYSKTRWTLGQEYLYQVKDGFPRIDVDTCPQGISGVSYSLDLEFCESYRVSNDDVIDALRGQE